MRIALVTDAWAPQVNGVVRTLEAVRATLERQGHSVAVISPDLYASLPCPTYPEIRLAIASSRSVGQRIAGFGADAVHLATEGPLCLAARRWCLRHGLPFTTAYHTQFPDYVEKRTGMPAAWIWRYIRWFHAPARAVLVSTPSIRRTLAAHGVAHLRHWGRGVDLAQFTPDAPPPPAFAGLARPIQLYVGRVAVEKNIAAFLATRHPGTRVVVGDGPARAELERLYPDALFLGALGGRALAGAYAGADVLVFPSRTDTFGLVMIEALACGTPVAAYPVSGPVDVLTAATGAMREDLGAAIAEALTRDRTACAAYGRSFSWEASAAQFLSALAPIAAAEAA
ncbi:glycosyltransferase [Sphingomonas changnyeongensis]|uniref:Glycosyltransferase n=1 Tax=Sphingomonas changnyeongensis TaxID=2698679 RepID=A0A7Z2NTY6_9SPHN|nr:glycosyltransferase family 1 protein [Sphingomonas changnyeongensis]QHL89808.1 glycosyltransferase [Sphingomonas changnyeongensis]